MYVCYVSDTFIQNGRSLIYYSSGNNIAGPWTQRTVQIYETGGLPWIFTDGDTLYVATLNVSRTSLRIFASVNGVDWSPFSTLGFSGGDPAIAVGDNGEAAMIYLNTNTGVLNVRYSTDLINWSEANLIFNSNGQAASTSERPSIVRRTSVFGARYKGKTNNSIYGASGYYNGILAETGSGLSTSAAPCITQ